MGGRKSKVGREEEGSRSRGLNAMAFGSAAGGVALALGLSRAAAAATAVGGVALAWNLSRDGSAVTTSSAPNDDSSGDEFDLQIKFRFINSSGTRKLNVVEYALLPTMTIPALEDKSVGSGSIKLQKPERGWVKVNFDGSFDKGSNTSGIGIIFRREDGQPIMASSKSVQCSSAIEAELMALFEALKMAKHWAADYSLWVEGDSSGAVEFLTEGKVLRPQHPHKMTVENCRALASAWTGYLKFKASHVGSKGNKPADWLAKRGRKTACDQTWSSKFPQGLLNLVWNDMYISLVI